MPKHATPDSKFTNLHNPERHPRPPTLVSLSSERGKGNERANGLDDWHRSNELGQLDLGKPRRVPALSEHKYKYSTDPDRVWQVLVIFVVATVLVVAGVL